MCVALRERQVAKSGVGRLCSAHTEPCQCPDGSRSEDGARRAEGTVSNWHNCLNPQSDHVERQGPGPALGPQKQLVHVRFSPS